MLLFIKVAWRNITRNLRRTLITLAAITFGLASIIILFGFTDGFHAQWVENSVKLYAGHVVVYADGFYENRNLNRNIKNAEYVEEMAGKAGGLNAFTTRVHMHGLASTAENSVAVLIRGIETEKEKQISGFDRRIVTGEYLDNEGGKEILLGHGLASRLHANIGNKVVLMVQAADGSIGAELFRLKGIFRAGAIDLDKHLAVISIKDAQDLAVIKGVTEVALILDGPEYVRPFTETLNQEIGSQGFDVLPWDTLMPQAREMIDLSSIFMYVVLAIFLVVVALGILNTMLMSIMERTREFGVMMALGTRPARIVSLVMLESLLLGLIGTVLGVIVGVSANRLVSIDGFDLSDWSAAMELVSSLNPVIYPYTDSYSVSLCAAAVFLTTLVVAIYPALKAARLRPVEAMHFV